MRLLPSAVALLSTVAAASCGDDTGPPDARVIDGPPAGGTVSLSWSIADDGAPLTCADVGASFVSLEIVPVEQVFGVTDTLSCATGQGTSVVVPPGQYNVTARLAGVAAPAVEFRDVLVETGEDHPLGEAAFQVEAVGGFTFRIATGKNTCGPVSRGGAGITGMQIELERIGSGCVPATFEITAGGNQPAGTYTTSCDAPAPFACIADSQQITVAPTLPSGPYRMAINGFVGGTPCWTRRPQFDVPAGGATENLPQQTLVFDEDNPACSP